MSRFFSWLMTPVYIAIMLCFVPWVMWPYLKALISVGMIWGPLDPDDREHSDELIEARRPLEFKEYERRNKWLFDLMDRLP